MDNKKVFVANLEDETVRNGDYRRVRFTAPHSQLVYMSLEPGVEIGNEIHGIDQFIRVEQGRAKAIVGNGAAEYELTDGSVIMVPAGTWHNIVNIGDETVKLYTVYSGPNHLRDTVQATKADDAEDEYDGITDLM